MTAVAFRAGGAFSAAGTAVAAVFTAVVVLAAARGVLAALVAAALAAGLPAPAPFQVRRAFLARATTLAMSLSV